MDRYIKLLIFIIVILFLYWCYVKYQKYVEKKKINKLTDFIKNNITITIYNMNQFTNLSSHIKLILLDIAKTYKHNDIIILLKKNK